MPPQGERVLRSQVLHLQQQVDQLNSKQVELLGQKHALQIAHQQELARFGHLKTAEELQSMLAALEKEVDTNAGHARKAAVSVLTGAMLTEPAGWSWCIRYVVHMLCIATPDPLYLYMCTSLQNAGSLLY